MDGPSGDSRLREPNQKLIDVFDMINDQLHKINISIDELKQDACNTKKLTYKLFDEHIIKNTTERTQDLDMQTTSMSSEFNCYKSHLFNQFNLKIMNLSPAIRMNFPNPSKGSPRREMITISRHYFTISMGLSTQYPIDRDHWKSTDFENLFVHQKLIKHLNTTQPHIKIYIKKDHLSTQGPINYNFKFKISFPYLFDDDISCYELIKTFIDVLRPFVSYIENFEYRPAPTDPLNVFTTRNVVYKFIFTGARYNYISRFSDQEYPIKSGFGGCFETIDEYGQYVNDVIGINDN